MRHLTSALFFVLEALLVLLPAALLGMVVTLGTMFATKAFRHDHDCPPRCKCPCHEKDCCR